MGSLLKVVDWAHRSISEPFQIPTKEVSILGKLFISAPLMHLIVREEFTCIRHCHIHCVKVKHHQWN
jgi:hypothetical protein